MIAPYDLPDTLDFTAIEPVILSQLVRGLIERLTLIEHTLSSLSARLTELEAPEYP